MYFTKAFSDFPLMDNIKQRELINEAKDFKSFDYEWHVTRYNEITSYLLSSDEGTLAIDEVYDDEDSRINLKRELFCAATISLCCIQETVNDNKMIIILQETFQKLGAENPEIRSWGVSGYPLNLLHYYMRAFRLYDDKKFPFHYATITDEGRRDGSYEVFSDDEKNALLIIGQDNLLQYCQSQRMYYAEDHWCRHEMAELMYQLNLANTDEIFDICKEYILDMEHTNMAFDLIRDDDIKAKAIDFLIESLETHLPKVEKFLVHHLALYNNDKEHYGRTKKTGRFTYLKPQQLEPLCSAYREITASQNDSMVKQMFLPSIIDERKTRFETAVEIYAAQLRFSNFAKEFKNYSQMEATIKNFIDSYLSDPAVRIKFLIHVRHKKEMNSPLIKRYMPSDDHYFKEIIKFMDEPIYPEDMHHLDNFFQHMLTFFGYEYKSGDTVELEQWLAIG